MAELKNDTNQPKPSEKEENNQNKISQPQANDQNSSVDVIIIRHKQLFDLLQRPKSMWKALLLSFLLIVILFLGLAFIVLSIKRFYPYNVIETTSYGATLIKNEDKDVIYWLFNSADLWANSGIEVDINDELTIRASGSSYTAVHHLVDASNKNSIPPDQWVSIEGQTPEMMSHMSSRDIARARFRISPTFPEGILLMQIIPADSINDGEQWYDNSANDHIITSGNIEVIGKERKGLHITKKGILHFAVNDIVFTQSIVDSMYCDFVDSVASKCGLSIDEREKIRKCFKDLPVKTNATKEDLNKCAKELTSCISRVRLSQYDKSTGLKLGPFPEGFIDSSYLNHPLINELVYYKITGFKNPWYVDNLGSFLIVIERKK